MSELPQPELPLNPERPSEALARRSSAPPAPILPAGIDSISPNLPFAARHPAPDSPPRRFPETPKPKTAILRGLKDLQQLQKQTLAVLEAVKGSLDDIQQVLRSPEATRGLEKQKNAATLLAKGFPRDAVEQAAGAAQLLPANPEAHLLLALSLAADQQLEPALAATRKGLALIDRRVNPLAIEAGLLHTLGALGSVAEALDRWSAIIDALPLPVLLEQTATIAACFPAASSTPPDDLAAPAGPALLDTLLTARLALAQPSAPQKSPSRQPADHRAARLIDTAPGEIPAASLLAGLDAASAAALPRTHKAILAQTARRLHAANTPADLLKFLTECVVPLANRNLKRAAGSLAKAAHKKLLRLHADAQTLHRAMLKFQMAETPKPAKKTAQLLLQWRNAGQKSARTKAALLAASAAFLIGITFLFLLLLPNPALPFHLSPAIPAAIFILLGATIGILALFLPTPAIPLPHNRPPLTPEELNYLRPLAIRHSLKSAARH